MEATKGEKFSQDPRRIALGVCFILIFILIIYLLSVSTWNIIIGMVIFIGGLGIGYLYIRRAHNRRQVAEAVAEELDRPDDWKTVQTAISISSVEDPYENKNLIDFLTDLIIQTNSYSVRQALVLSPYKENSLNQTKNNPDFEYLVKIINSKNVSDVVGRVIHDPYKIQREMNEIKMEQGVGEVEPAHRHQLKQGNVGKAVAAGILESAIEENRDLEYTARIRSHKDYDIKFIKDTITFTTDDIENIDEKEGNPIEEGDVVELNFRINVSDRGLEPTTVTSVKFLHENEEPVLNKAREVSENIDQAIEAIRRLVDLLEKGSITKQEFDAQLEAVLNDSIQGGVPPIDAVDYIERLDIYREYNTISDDDYEYAKSLLLNRESVLMTELERIELSSLNDEELNQIEYNWIVFSLSAIKPQRFPPVGE